MKVHHLNFPIFARGQAIVPGIAPVFGPSKDDPAQFISTLHSEAEYARLWQGGKGWEKDWGIVYRIRVKPKCTGLIAK